MSFCIGRLELFLTYFYYRILFEMQYIQACHFYHCIMKIIYGKSASSFLESIIVICYRFKYRLVDVIEV